MGHTYEEFYWRGVAPPPAMGRDTYDVPEIPDTSGVHAGPNSGGGRFGSDVDDGGARRT